MYQGQGQGEGRNGGRGRGRRGSEAPLELYSIHRAKVSEVRPYGFMVELEGHWQKGLVHRTQVSHNEVTKRSDSIEEKVEKFSSVANKGQLVWVKVISVNANNTFECSMKYVNKDDGTDLDPDNIKIKPEQARALLKKLQKEKRPVYNVECELCKERGHLEAECN